MQKNQNFLKQKNSPNQIAENRSAAPLYCGVFFS